MACVVKRIVHGRERWVVDFRDQNGKRRWRVFKTKKQATDAHAELSIEVRDRTFVDPASLPSFETVARQWHAARMDRAPQTVEFWRSQLDLHLIPDFGGKRIDCITSQDVEAWKMRKWHHDEPGGEGLARTTVNQMLQTLRGVFGYALQHGHIKRNPADRDIVQGLRKQRKAAKKVDAVDPSKVLTAEGAGKVIACAEVGLFQTFIKMALLTGARTGELQALRWQDLDLEAGALAVNQSLAWVPGPTKGYGKAVAIFGPPKSDASIRTLELPAELVRDLKAWWMSRRPEWKGAEALVFTNTLGKPLHRSHLTKGLHAACDAAGVGRIGLHGCRHTFASLLLAAGRPITEVAKLLGHSDPQVTLKRYAHWHRETSSRDTMEGLAAAIGGSHW